MRVEPDIAAEADPATGILVGETQTFPNGAYYDQYRIGGTSVPLGFLNPRLYSMYGSGGAFTDVLAAPKTDLSRADYANSLDSSQGFFSSTRIVVYEGTEQFCDQKGNCTTQSVSIGPAPGYDNMTGLGSPGPNFVLQLAGA